MVVGDDTADNGWDADDDDGDLLGVTKAVTAVLLYCSNRQAERLNRSANFGVPGGLGIVDYLYRGEWAAWLDFEGGDWLTTTLRKEAQHKL